MATLTRENIGLLNDKLTVIVTKEDYLKNFDNSLKKYAKNANIPGFRKGMVPAGLVKKMYGQGVFTEEVLKIAENELYNFLETEKLDIFAQPLPLEFDVKQLDINNPSDYSLSFEVGLKPNLSIDASSFNVIKYVIETEDKMVEEETERLRARFGKLTEPETISNEEDMLNVKFEESDKDGNVIDGGISKEDSILLKYFKESFRNNLLNKKVGDSVVLQLIAAFDDKELDFVTKDLGLDKANNDDLNRFFKLSISKIGFVVKADYNEEFFANALPNKTITTESEFKQVIKDDVAKAFESQSRNQMHDQIYHSLLDTITVELPENFLKRWLQTGGEKPKTAEEAENEYPSFASSLKWTLISSKIATDNSVTVENDDIKAFAKEQLASYMGMGLDLEGQPWVDEYVNKMMKDRKFVEDSFYKIQTEKMFAILETQVKIKEENISFENFKEKFHNHNH